MILNIVEGGELQRALRSPAPFIRIVLHRATFMLSSIAEVDIRDDCAREVAVAACAAGFAQMGETLAVGIDDKFQQCWARVEIAFTHATLRRMAHARPAIQAAKKAVYGTPANDPIPCEIISLLARACAEIADVDGFEEAAHRVPEATRWYHGKPRCRGVLRR